MNATQHNADSIQRQLDALAYSARNADPAGLAQAVRVWDRALAALPTEDREHWERLGRLALDCGDADCRA